MAFQYICRTISSKQFYLDLSQTGVTDLQLNELNNPSFVEPIEKLDEIAKTIAKLFKRK